MAHLQQPPIAPTAHMHFNVDEMITITRRLTDILSEEAGLLKAMKLKDIGSLQEEKQKLSKQLDSMQRLLAADDSPVRTLDLDRKEELILLSEGLEDTIQEALYRSAIAQQANARVVQIFVEAMAETQRTGVYGNQGQAAGATGAPISLNLNEQA